MNADVGMMTALQLWELGGKCLSQPPQWSEICGLHGAMDFSQIYIPIPCSQTRPSWNAAWLLIVYAVGFKSGYCLSTPSPNGRCACKSGFGAAGATFTAIGLNDEVRLSGGENLPLDLDSATTLFQIVQIKPDSPVNIAANRTFWPLLLEDAIVDRIVTIGHAGVGALRASVDSRKARPGQRDIQGPQAYLIGF